MRDLGTFFQICIYITACVIFFTLSVSFVNSLGVFPYTVESGIETGGGTNATFLGLTISDEYGSGVSMDTVWSIVFTASGIGALFVAWITRSISILGVYIFSVVFWSAYVNALSIINIGGFLSDLMGFVVIGTVGMVIVFAGAVAGMLSGSG